MSIYLLSAAFRTDLPTVQKFVLVALCDSANGSGECFPSISRLMAKCSLSERSVRSAIRELEAQGFLICRFRKGSSNDYVITNPGTWACLAANAPRQDVPHTPAGDAPPTPAGRAAPPAGGAPPPRQDVPPPPAGGAHITVSEPSYEPSLNQEHDGDTTRFGSFAMPLDWQPDRNTFDLYALRSGVRRTDLTDEMLTDFTGYWNANGAFQTEAQWVHKLVSRIKHQKSLKPAAIASSRHDLSSMNYGAGVTAGGKF